VTPCVVCLVFAGPQKWRCGSAPLPLRSKDTRRPRHAPSSREATAAALLLTGGRRSAQPSASACVLIVLPVLLLLSLCRSFVYSSCTREVLDDEKVVKSYKGNEARSPFAVLRAPPNRERCAVLLRLAVRFGQPHCRVETKPTPFPFGAAYCRFCARSGFRFEREHGTLEDYDAALAKVRNGN